MEKLVSIIIPVYNQEKLIIKALDSIPPRNDLEILVINDGSTDRTGEVVQNYIDHHPDKDIKYFVNESNRGVGYTENVGHDNATGIWWVRLDSDDYFLSNFSEFIDKYLTDSYDMVYFDIQTNQGSIWKSHNIKDACVGAVKFVRRSFMKDLRCPEVLCGEDYYLNESLLKNNPRILFTKELIKHYNYPREGSLTDLRKKHVEGY